MPERKPKTVSLTVATAEGAKDTGPMSERDARIVENLAEIMGAITARTGPGR